MNRTLSAIAFCATIFGALVSARDAAATSVRAYATGTLSNFTSNGTVSNVIITANSNNAFSAGTPVNIPAADPDTPSAYIGTAPNPGQNFFTPDINNDTNGYGHADSRRNGTLFVPTNSIELVAEASAITIGQTASGSAGYTITGTIAGSGNMQLSFNTNLLADTINTGLAIGSGTASVSLTAIFGTASFIPTVTSIVGGGANNPSGSTNSQLVTLTTDVGVSGSQQFQIFFNVSANTSGGNIAAAGPAPEPSSLVMLGLAGIGMLVARRRKLAR